MPKYLVNVKHQAWGANEGNWLKFLNDRQRRSQIWLHEFPESEHNQDFIYQRQRATD